MVDFRGKTAEEEKKQETLPKKPETQTQTNTHNVLWHLGNVQRKIRDNLKRIETSTNLHPNDRQKTEEKIKKLRESEERLQRRLDLLKHHQSNDCHPSWEI